MRLGTPGPQFHHYFGDPFVKLGTPLKRARTHSARLFNCLSNYSTAVKRLIRSFRKWKYKEDGLHQSAHSSVGLRWLADWQHCRCRRLQRQRHSPMLRTRRMRRDSPSAKSISTFSMVLIQVTFTSGEGYHESCLNRMIPSEAWIDSKYKWTYVYANISGLMFMYS